MTYLKWFNSHAKKHKKIVDSLKNKTDDEIIEYFRWDNISKSDVDFCPLFKEGKKCHDIQNLNCYLCACPNFRFDDNASKIKSYCSIDSKNGRKLFVNEEIHQDCSGCVVAHSEKYIKKYFDRDWKRIFKRNIQKENEP